MGAVEPVATLGGELPEDALTKEEKKKQKKKQQKVYSIAQYVLCTYQQTDPQLSEYQQQDKVIASGQLIALAIHQLWSARYISDEMLQA